ncbi:MAG TPA: translocation/assembly module TamB domain-containing protein [Candidatus Limnocylindria bacterium]|nr:translocation/assembly module TamB domain-containing protein [Candidatus Limnocylindria bacterium]
MSDSRPPDDREPKKLDSDDPRGLTEELKQAVEKIEDVVEDVVEHVPKPVRWTIGKIVMLAGLGLVGLVILLMVTAVLYVANRTEWAAEELTVLLNQMLVTRSDVALSIGDLKGNPLRSVRVLRPTLRFRDGTGQVLLEAPSMTVSYSAWDFLRGAQRRIDIVIDSPVVRLARGADGKVRLPTWKQGEARQAGKPLDLSLRLRGGTIRMPEATNDIEGLELDAVAATGARTRVDVRSLRWRRGPFDTPLEKLRAHVTAADTVRVHVHELRTPDLVLHGVAEWKSGESRRHVRAEIERVRWRWLARVFRNTTFDVPGEGRASIDARGGPDWAGSFRTRAVWSDLPLEAEGQLAWADGRLTLDPLTGRSRAGDLTGKVTWSKQGWEVGGDARNANPEHWDAIQLRDWPAGNLNGRFRYAVDTRGRPRARLAAQLDDSEWSGWRADSGGVIVDFPAVGPDSFRVRALRRGGELTLDGRAAAGGWQGEYTVTEFPLDEWPDGRASGLRGTLASGRGTVNGRAGALDVTGVLEGTSSEWFGLKTARWRLTDVSGRLLPKPDLTAQARLEDVLFLGLHFDSAATPVRLADQQAGFSTLTAQAGDTTVTLRGDAAWHEGGWRFTAESAEMQSPSFHWTVEPPLALVGDPNGVSFERLLARDGEAQVTMEGRWAGPGGRYDWSARAERLDLSRLGLPSDLGLGGRANARLRVSGIYGDPRWELDAAASTPSAQGHRADSVAIRIGGAPGRLEVSDAALVLAGGTLGVRGAVTAMSEPWPDTLTADGVLQWVAGAGRWEGTARAQEFPLERVGRMVPAAEGWGGKLSGTLEVGGRPAAPVLSLAVEARPLARGEARVDAVNAKARYAAGQLDVPEIKIARGGVTSTITGEMPMRLALGESPELPEAPMSWQVDLPNGDLALLPLFVAQLGQASGRFDLDARIGGTVREPDLRGTARIRQGKLRLAGREELLEEVYADLTFDEARISLDTLAARQRTRQGDAGRVQAHGEVRLQGMVLDNYRFNLSLREFTALETGLYAAVLDGNFVITKGPRIGGTTVPRVDGEVELRRGVVLFDFAKQSEIEQIAASTQPLYWTYRLHLSATDNLIWQPPDGRIEFSADLNLEQTVDSLIIYGDVRSLRGDYYFLSNRFTVQRADLTFDNLDGVNPLIAAEAETQVPRATPEDAETVGLGTQDERGQERIFVTISGRVREPVIEFSSENNWDEPQILRAITVGRFVDEKGGLAFEDPLDSYVTQALNRQLSADLSRAFRGYLNEWEVARESGGLVRGTGGVLVRVGIPLTSRLAVRYGQRVPGLDRPDENVRTGTVERDIEAEYRLNRFFYVSSELTQRRTLTGSTSTVSSSPDFNVNLKARWEY